MQETIRPAVVFYTGGDDRVAKLTSDNKCQSTDRLKGAPEEVAPEQEFHR